MTRSISALLICAAAVASLTAASLRDPDTRDADKPAEVARLRAHFDSVLGELRATIGNRDGRAQLDSAMLTRHLRPVLDAVADGLRRNLVQKFGKPQPPGAPPPQVDGADVAAILLTLFGPPKKK